MKTKNTGIATAEAALQIVTSHIAVGESTMADLTASLDHLNSTPKATLLEAIAYLAAQVTAYRDASDEDARLFVSQVTAMVGRYEERKASLKQRAAVAA
jgi:hypothetical protein